MKFEYADKEQHPAFRYGANNYVGTYPLGALFNWHGGMHINENRNTAIKAIADGTIIAYRLNKEPFETNNGLKFSSGFVLIQHQYKSPKGREFTFYSLYNHLMPYDELIEFSNIPDVFKSETYTVWGKYKHKENGILSYGSLSKAFPKVIPVNTIVQKDNTIGVFEEFGKHWSQGTDFKKVKYIHSESGAEIKDRYIQFNDTNVEKINDNMYRVIGHVANGECWEYEKLRSSANFATDDNVVMQVPNKSKFTIEKKTGSYFKIKTLNGKAQEGYIYAKSCKEDGFVLDFDENNLDKIITGNDCNIPVKAGDIIGFTGPMGHIGSEQHRTNHLEVFSATDPTEFLKGKEGDKDDITDTNDFIKIAKGAMLSHHYPYTFKSGDEILVLQVEGEYLRIKLNKQLRTVEKANLGNGTAPTAETGNYTYTNFNLDKINEAFEGTVTKGSVIILNEDASQFTKGQTSRDVSYTLPDGEHCYWVHKDNLPLEATAMGQYLTLNSDINQLFESKPNKNYVSQFFPNDSETQTELMGDHIIGKKEVEEIRQGNQTWYKIKLQDYRGERKGFIKSNNKNITMVSAHDWTAFGFKVLKDQPDNFIFDATEKKAPQFLKSVFKEMDTDGNKKLSSLELRRGLNDMYVCERLSKLVCYHQSEWGVNYSSLKQEVETLLDKGIEQEENKEIKALFIKQKENTLKVIEDKVNALNFWGKVKIPGKEIPTDMTYVSAQDKYRKMHPWETVQVLHPDDENHGLKPFPKDTKVYHFHPNAFVEQMRRMNIEKIGYVDWSFIKKREGELIITGYVPTKSVKKTIILKDKDGKPIIKNGKVQEKIITEEVVIDKSGVTISSGFDIGQHNKFDLKTIFKGHETLLNLYLPYVSKNKKTAVDFLTKNPLKITKEQAILTDQLIKQAKTNQVIKEYNKYKMPKNFKNLSIGIQTVIMSICYQYGPYSDKHKPIWEALKEDDNSSLIEFWENESKTSKYYKRRNLELNYLKKHINDYKN